MLQADRLETPVGRDARGWHCALASFVVLALLTSTDAWSGGASLGTARGVRSAALSFDGGNRWLALDGVSLPVLDGGRIRSGTGAVFLDLTDGSRMNLLPFSELHVAQSGAAARVTLEYGRVTFRLPPSTRVAIETPTARLEPVRTAVVVGEAFAGQTTGLKMTRGAMLLRGSRPPRDVSGAAPPLVVSREPAFFPATPAMKGRLFTSDTAGDPVPGGGRSVFDAKGRSVGYLLPDGQLVVHAGYTADLTGPFPPRTVQVARANIPETSRAYAEPLFDVNGLYVGYVAGPAFHPSHSRGAPTATVTGAAAGVTALGMADR